MDEEHEQNEENQNQALTVSNPFTRIAGDLKKKIKDLINNFKEPKQALPPGKTPTTREIKVVQSHRDVFSMMGGNPLKKLIDRITTVRINKTSSKDEIENKAMLVKNGEYQHGDEELKSLKDANVIIPTIPRNPIIATPKEGIVIEEIGGEMFSKTKEPKPEKDKREVHIESGTIGEETPEISKDEENIRGND